MAIEDAGIRAYVPLPDFEPRPPFFGKQRFVYEADTDQYRCPGGQGLPFRMYSYTERLRTDQADAATCNACPLKAQCTASDQGRMIKRHFEEEYLDRVRGYTGPPRTHVFPARLVRRGSTAQPTPSCLTRST